MPENTHFDLVVIGAGPGGYVAAIRAAQLGLKVACVEKDKTLGGTCLNVGCIPSKALLESSELYAQAREKFALHGIQAPSLSVDLAKIMERKDQVVRQLTGGIAALFKKNKITSITGEARVEKDRTVLVRQEAGEICLTATHVIIATGSDSTLIPGIVIDQKKIVDSTGALSLTRVPGELIVIGGGAIGLELGSVYARLGSQVTVLEAMDRIVPGMDHEISKNFQRVLQKQGLKFRLGVQVKGASAGSDRVSVVIESSPGTRETLEADVLLVAVGRRPRTEALNLENAGIQTDAKGRIIVDERGQTTLAGVYAVGDVTGGAMLAHKASEEGVAVAERISGHEEPLCHRIIPNIIYTWPEVASAGLTEEQAMEQGLEYKTAKFPFLANGRSLAAGEKDGLVKLIADKGTDRLLGAHILGPRASDLIAEIVLALELSATTRDIARTIHAHPTYSEAIHEAALGLGSGFLHL